MIRKLLCLKIIGILCFTYFSGLAQIKTKMSAYPEVGKPMPDFVFKNVKYYTKKQVSLKDFRGKWLILSLWTKNCGSCIEGFPSDNAIQKKLGNKAQILMVGDLDKERYAEYLFAHSRDKFGLQNLPCAFDSLIFKRYNIVSTPRVFIIDPKGIVRSVNVGDFSAQNIEDFIAGKNPFALFNGVRKKFDDRRPFLINGNGGNDTDFLYRSLLSKWNPSMDIGGPSEIYLSPTDEYSKSVLGKFQTLRESVYRLYLMAYRGASGTSISMDNPSYGKVNPKLVLEVRDSSLFDFADSLLITGRNFYNYSLIVPPEKASKRYMMEVMQRDLKNYFGYDVSVEIRKMPYLRLIATEAAKTKLKTKGDSTNVITSKVFDGKQWNWIRNCRNISISKMLHIVGWRNYVPYGMPCVLDETGIKDNIDIVINIGDGYDTAELVKGLRDNGLDIIKGEKEMEVIVIKDPKTAPAINLEK